MSNECACGCGGGASGHVEYVRLSSRVPANGHTEHFDRRGRSEADGPIRWTTLGVSFIWAPFSKPIDPGQIATMVLENVPGAFTMDGAATEWNVVTREPTLGEGIIELISIERGVGDGRIVCRNAFDAPLHVAAGIGVPILPPS